MTNKHVPLVYRTIIDDVIANVKSEFEDYGVSEDVLSLLQEKWENKVVASRVADFEVPAQPVQIIQSQPPPQPQPPPMRQVPQAYQLPPPPHYIKTEPVERPYVPMPSGALPPNMGTYMLPPINPGPPNHLNGRPGQSVLVLPKGAPPPGAQISQQNGSPLKYAGGGGSGGRIPQLDGSSYLPAASVSAQDASSVKAKIPQLDGAGSSGSSSEGQSPKDQKPSVGGATGGGDEEINSDLDDSDSDGEGDDDIHNSGGADIDMVFCTYDKVARVKNKWKCVLKDGMINVAGKDYLFSKCNGEFEW